jgi:hypothetical protein
MEKSQSNPDASFKAKAEKVSVHRRNQNGHDFLCCWDLGSNLKQHKPKTQSPEIHLGMYGNAPYSVVCPTRTTKSEPFGCAGRVGWESSVRFGDESNHLLPFIAGGRVVIKQSGEYHFLLYRPFCPISFDTMSAFAPPGEQVYLVFGGQTGWIGGMLVELLRQQGKTFHLAESRTYNRESVLAEIEKYKPTHILNAAGVTGRPNVDWCEDHKVNEVFLRRRVSRAIDYQFQWSFSIVGGDSSYQRVGHFDHRRLGRLEGYSPFAVRYWLHLRV